MAATDLGTTMDSLLACLCEKLAEAGRPVCEDKCGHTIGPPVIGPTVCCECDDTDDTDDTGPGGQLSVTLQRMYPVDGTTFAQVARLENCRPGAVAADLAFTLTRCHPTIDETGTPPTLVDVAPYADGVVDDVQTLWNALFCCPNFSVVIRDTAVDSDPQGGCSAIGLRVSVLVKPLTPVVGS